MFIKIAFRLIVGLPCFYFVLLWMLPPGFTVTSEMHVILLITMPICQIAATFLPSWLLVGEWQRGHGRQVALVSLASLVAASIMVASETQGLRAPTDASMWLVFLTVLSILGAYFGTVSFLLLHVLQAVNWLWDWIRRGKIAAAKFGEEPPGVTNR